MAMIDPRHGGVAGRRARHVLRLAVVPCALLGSQAARAQEGTTVYEPAPMATTQVTTRLGVTMTVLVDREALGGAELAMVEITLPSGEPLVAGEHRHGAIEVFYILEGELEHVVNGQPRRLGPGTVGLLRPGDAVRHRVVSSEPVRALLLWVPGTELDAIRSAHPSRQLPEARSAAADMAGLTRLRDRWTAAYQRGDVAALEALYTPDAVRMPYDAPSRVGRTAVLDDYRAAFGTRARSPDITLTAEEVHVTPTMAVERGHYREVFGSAPGGARITEEGTYVALARRDPDGHWRYEWSIFNRDAAR